jgi:hypothetical protein
MNKFEIEIPSNAEEFDKLTKEEKMGIVERMNEIKNQSQDFLIRMVEERVAPILLKNPYIEDLTLDPKYEYNDEGYAPSYIMPFINGEYYMRDGDGDDLFEKIDYACSDIAGLITSDISIDVQEVKTRYAANQLDKKLPKKEIKSKRFKT